MMEFEVGTGGIRRSSCKRYAIVDSFSAAYGCTVYRAWRVADERTFDTSLGEFFKPRYAIEACEHDAGITAFNAEPELAERANQ